MAFSTAVVVDSWELFRLGVEKVLNGLDIHVTASFSQAGAGVRTARSEAADLLIVGRCADLKHNRVLRAVKALENSPRVVFLLDQAEKPDVARLLSGGSDALLLRTTKAADLSDAILRMEEGQRVVSPALAATTLGRIGPAVQLTEAEAGERSGLSPKELEVLAVLAEGATYKEIAESLIVTQATVKTHLVHIYAKLEVKNREQAISKALALGLLG